MNDRDNPKIRDKVQLTQPEQLYQIRDKEGNIIDLEQANGRELFNHYRHNVTNYDQVLDNRRDQQGYVTGRQEKEAVIGAAEQVLEKYRDEHIKVIKDGQKKGALIKQWFDKVGVGTALAFTHLLDSWSEKIKEVAKLQNSQRTLQTWNDTYRVQRELVKKLLKDEEVSEEIIEKVNKIYSTRSVNKVVELGTDLFDLKKSEMLKLVKSAIRYAKLNEESKS
ncbi:hypothetical protein VB715_03980 [Crocosphaera sp. UHCC 0190]|uniref:hypothetical protein n=1 Tax=Crocosphaera sp. UHCC 0190 TaxID=3110246 RepID=UPI002B20C01E|nr:hypothetical protein [Crocosphaera sp. UHCC 0190]MEA5508915.1 hypothetical protein [Crocosphaera sp. UHCC 0190]